MVLRPDLAIGLPLSEELGPELRQQISCGEKVGIGPTSAGQLKSVARTASGQEQRPFGPISRTAVLGPTTVMNHTNRHPLFPYLLGWRAASSADRA
jgi:hypothetical protein